MLQVSFAVVFLFSGFVSSLAVVPFSQREHVPSVINNAILHCRAQKGQDRHLMFTSYHYNSRRKTVILVSKEIPECLGLAADISARSATRVLSLLRRIWLRTLKSLITCSSDRVIP